MEHDTTHTDRVSHPARALWKHLGTRRPDFAVPPGPDQESVWDYPRPPCLVPDPRHVVVRRGERILADTRRSLRLLETASPPCFYLPPEDVARQHLVRVVGGSYCEWKGAATYYDVVLPGGALRRSFWTYERPLPPYEALAGWFACYPEHFECRVDGVLVTPQQGGFYGGWITPEIVGPFKGEPGTSGW